MTAGSVSASRVSGTVGATTLHPPSTLKLSVEEQKRFLQDQSITKVTSATKWRVITHEDNLPGQYWVIQFLRYYRDQDCAGAPSGGNYIGPYDGTAIHSASEVNFPAINAFKNTGFKWKGLPVDGNVFVGMEYNSMVEVRCVYLDQPVDAQSITTATVQAYHEGKWVNVWNADVLQVGGNIISMDHSSLADAPNPSPSDVPSSSPTSQIQNFASGAEDDFQISAKEGDILFADEEDGGGSIIFNLEISKPLAGYSPFV
eukprot:CAMPEP_0196803498 /NCGR_PEP_ID=MMETSP1362-20130617/2924_1 /TAXON_ID=163516 /ORGANISM="Leptocylindrus danicus, Strain CCMP1856" /LENGTH=257 /DNA_ID=CAMNT_0042175137 /DNA_START=16 /DNA_END=786 /DNA_ORIENTATION=+